MSYTAAARIMDTPSLTILDELPVGVWVGRAPDAEVSYANRAFRTILGMDAVKDSRVGDVSRTYRVFDRAGNPFPVDRLPFSRVMATGAIVEVDDMVIHRSDGVRVSIRAFGQPLRDAAGAISGAALVYHDRAYKRV